MAKTRDLMLYVNGSLEMCDQYESTILEWNFHSDEMYYEI